MRAALRARDRPEIEQLTGQRKLPLLVIGGEAIVDSKRIVEHLRWRADTGMDSPTASGG